MLCIKQPSFSELRECESRREMLKTAKRAQEKRSRAEKKNFGSCFPGNGTDERCEDRTQHYHHINWGEKPCCKLQSKISPFAVKLLRRKTYWTAMG